MRIILSILLALAGFGASALAATGKGANAAAAAAAYEGKNPYGVFVCYAYGPPDWLLIAVAGIFAIRIAWRLFAHHIGGTRSYDPDD